MFINNLQYILFFLWYIECPVLHQTLMAWDGIHGYDSGDINLKIIESQGRGLGGLNK